MRWGLCRSWEKELTKPFVVFNARCESVASTPMFKTLLQAKRCVVMLDGFYEFKDLGNKRKQPYYLHSKTRGNPLMFAALYDVWSGPDSTVASVTFLTMDSMQSLHWLHHRQPMILDEETARAWLNPDEDGEVVLSLVRKTCEEPSLQWHPVSNKINKAEYQGSDCSMHIDEVKGSITSFFGRGGRGKEEVVKEIVKEEEVMVVKEEEVVVVKGEEVMELMSSTTSSSSSSSTSTTGGCWSCSFCTLSNKLHHLRCGACDQPKGSSASAMLMEGKKRSLDKSFSSSTAGGRETKKKKQGSFMSFFSKKKHEEKTQPKKQPTKIWIKSDDPEVEM